MVLSGLCNYDALSVLLAGCSSLWCRQCDPNMVRQDKVCTSC